KRNIRSSSHDAEERKRHDTKRHRDSQAGKETEPGEKLRWRISPRPLQQDREQICAEVPEPENSETKDDDKSGEEINDALRNAFHIPNEDASTVSNLATDSAS